MSVSSSAARAPGVERVLRTITTSALLRIRTKACRWSNGDAYPRTGFVKPFDKQAKLDMLNPFVIHVGGSSSSHRNLFLHPLADPYFGGSGLRRRSHVISPIAVWALAAELSTAKHIDEFSRRRAVGRAPRRKSKPALRKNHGFGKVFSHRKRSNASPR